MISRRAFLALGGGLLAQAPAAPNIVLILCDDLGYGDVGAYYPGAKIPTPHMDKLAREGMRFTDAHSPSSVCTPTQATASNAASIPTSRARRSKSPPAGSSKSPAAPRAR